MRYSSRYSSGSFWGGDYPMVKKLLMANFLAYAIQWILMLMGMNFFVESHLALNPRVWNGEVWQLFTYMFLHSVDDPFHILFNMFGLWMFGKELEIVWGSRQFLKYYLICGLGAGLTFLLFSKGSVIGASGAVFGILLAFGMTFPNQIVLMSLIFPIKAKYMVIIYGVITFMNIARPGADNIAHFAHLGGMVVGFLYLKRHWILEKLNHAMASPPKVPKNKSSMYLRPKSGRTDRSDKEEMRRKVDAILDKINEVGYDHLTAEEKQLLVEASHHLSESDKKS